MHLQFSEYRKMLSSRDDDIFFCNPDDLIAENDQPFDCYFDTPKFEELLNNIKLDGQNTPCLLKSTPLGDVIIDGRHRRTACKILGRQVKCTYKNYHEDNPEKEQARFNLTRCMSHATQRELSHKEKAKMYQQMKKCYEVLGEKKTTAKIREDSSESLRTISRYIQIAELPDDLLDLIVAKRIDLMASYEISFFDDYNNFSHLYEFLINHEKLKIKRSQGKALRNLENKLSLDFEVLYDFFYPSKGDSSSEKAITSIIIQCDELPFPTDGMTETEIKQAILDTLNRNSSKGNRQNKP